MYIWGISEKNLGNIGCNVQNEIITKWEVICRTYFIFKNVFYLSVSLEEMPELFLIAQSRLKIFSVSKFSLSFKMMFLTLLLGHLSSSCHKHIQKNAQFTKWEQVIWSENLWNVCWGLQRKYVCSLSHLTFKGC